MADWERDSPQLRQNLAKVLNEIARAAGEREVPTVASAKSWHRGLMKNLAIPDTRFVGAFRGEPGLGKIQVRVGSAYGVAADEVAEAVVGFERRLHGLMAELDSMIPAGSAPDSDQMAAIIDLCAWVHAEWIRIHPFANGNGLTARLWANCIAMRYGLPPFIRLRPRPESSYGAAGAKAMRFEWEPTAIVFRRMLEEFLGED